METINLDFKKIIDQQAAKRGLSATDVKIAFTYMDEILYMRLVMSVFGEEQSDKFCMDDFTFEEAVNFILDRFFVVSDDLYEAIAEEHLEGVDFDKYIDGVRIEAYEDGRHTYMITSRSWKDGWKTFKYVDLTNNFDVDKYWSIRERVRDKREEADRIRFETESNLRKSA